MFEATEISAVSQLLRHAARNMRREHLLHACLFLCAYAGFVAYYGIGMRKVVAPSSATRLMIGEATAQRQQLRSETSIAPPLSSTQTIALPVANTPAASLSKSDVTTSAEGTLPADVRAEIVTLAAKATTAEVPTQRRSAINKLGGLPLTAETIQALHATLINDPVPVNRVQATNALRRLAQANGDEDGKIQMLLNAALQDAEPAVVSAARATIERLTEPET